MPAIAETDLARMRDGLLFDGPGRARKLTRFWILLVLAALIAIAGVIGDSTATVIGAMIVAPLMTPILGTVLSIVVGDARNLLRSVLLVAAGSATVVLLAWAFGHLIPVDVVAETNSQVAARVHPRLIDLVAALATGAVGAFALVRDDVSDTLPGVAIAISLVPPLAVVGLTLESGAGHESAGALLLFLTNVAAILLSGLVVMAIYRVRRVSLRVETRRLGHRLALLVVVAGVVAVAGPLAAASEQIATDATERSDVATVAETWAAKRSWTVVSVETTDDGVLVRAIGPLPIPDGETLRADLDANGLAGTDVVLELTPSQRFDLPAA